MTQKFQCNETFLNIYQQCGWDKIGLAVMVAYTKNNQPRANKSYKVLKSQTRHGVAA